MCDQSERMCPIRGCGRQPAREAAKVRFRNPMAARLIQHHIQDVVRRCGSDGGSDGHAVLQSGFPNGFFQRRHHFLFRFRQRSWKVAVFLGWVPENTPWWEISSIWGIFFQINHVRFPPLHPLCCRPHRGPAAVERGPPQACQSSYPLQTGNSRCLRALASAMASIMARALFKSFSLGIKTWCSGSICLGLMTDLPSKPAF